MEANSTTAFFSRPFFKALMAEKVLREAQRIATGAATFRIGIAAGPLNEELRQIGQGAFTKIEPLHESSDLALLQNLERTLGQKLLADAQLGRKCRNEAASLGAEAPGGAPTYFLYVAYAPFVASSSERPLFPGMERQFRRGA